MKLFDKETESLEGSLFSEIFELMNLLLPVIAIVIGGAISYTIQGLASALTQTAIGFTYRMSIATALTVGPIAGIIAGLGYGFLGFFPTLLLEKSKRFRDWKKEYIKNIIRSEMTIVVAMGILVTLDLTLQIWDPVPWDIYLRYLPKRIFETLVIFGGFPLIGATVVEGFKRTKKVLLEK